MKQLIRLSLISSLAFNTTAFALNPMMGFYGGIFGEISAGPASYTIIVPDFIAPPVTPIARVNNNRIGGGGGAQIGYRLCNFRAELELLFNYINAQSLDVGACNLITPSVPPTDICLEDSFQVNGTAFNGNTGALYGMANAYFDFYRNDGCDGKFAPYIGVGIGEVRIQNRVNFVNTIIPLPDGVIFSQGAKTAFTTSAVQGIIGGSWYLDDFTWIGIDYRYVVTGAFNSTGIFSADNSLLIPESIRYGLHTLNLSVNVSFDQCTN